MNACCAKLVYINYTRPTSGSTIFSTSQSSISKAVHYHRMFSHSTSSPSASIFLGFFRSTGCSHPPRRSLLRIRVCQRKEVTFKDPSGIVSTGLRLQLTTTYNVSAGARLVVQSRVPRYTAIPADQDYFKVISASREELPFWFECRALTPRLLSTGNLLR